LIVCTLFAFPKPFMEAPMAKKEILDLTRVVMPLCLLELKRALMNLSPGQVLQVKLEDAAMLKPIGQTVAGTGDRLLKTHLEDDLIWLSIGKSHENK
jgi:TusA-related sulfurtransferase